MGQLAHERDRQALWSLSTTAAIIAGLCCLTPIVILMLGIAGVAAAASLGNVLYGEYRWAFRGVALLCLFIGLVIYFRRRGICTLEEARRQRQRLINAGLLVVFTAIGVYILWTYVILHYWGIAAGLPWAQYDEKWAIPTSIVLLALAVLATFGLRRSKT